MAQIRRIQKKDSGLGQLGSLVSVGGGIATGNPLMATGGAIGLAGQAQANQATPGSVSAPQTAIDRRASGQQIPIQQRMEQLRAAEVAIPDLPREVQEEVAPVIFNAMAQTANEFKKQQRLG